MFGPLPRYELSCATNSMHILRCYSYTLEIGLDSLALLLLIFQIYYTHCSLWMKMRKEKTI